MSLENTQEISKKVSKIILQSQHFFSRGDKKEAFYYLKMAMKLYATPYAGRIKSTFGQFKMADSEHFEAEITLREALHLSRQENDIFGQIHSLFSLCYLESSLGHHLEALELVREGLDLVNTNNYLEYLAIGYFNQGRVYWALGNLNIALKYCNFAIDSTIYIGENYLTLFNIRNLRGVIRRAQGDFSGALNDFSEARQITISNNLIDTLPLIFNNLGHLFNNTGDLAKAEYYLQKSVLVSEDIDKTNWLGSAYTELADNFALRGFYSIAHSYFEKSLGVNISLGRSPWYDYSRIAELEGNFGHYQEAVHYFTDALQEMEQTGEKRFFADTSATFARVLIKLDRKDEASKIIVNAKDYLIQQGQGTPPSLILAEGVLKFVNEGNVKAIPYFLKAYSSSKEQMRIRDVIESSLYVIRSFLTQYSENQKDHYFLLAQKYVEETLIIAKKANFYPQIFSIEFLKGGLHVAEYNYGLAIKIIMEAVEKASDLGFDREIDDGRRFIQQIQRAIQKVGHIYIDSINFQYQTGALINYINRLIHFEAPKVKGIDSSDFIFLGFKFEETGHEPFYISSSLERIGKEQNQIEFLLNLGALLSFLIGQGQQYFTGLFGPLPIRFMPESSALIYSTRVMDSEPHDNRLNGNYVIFCIIYPQKLDSTFIGRAELKEQFKAFLNSYPDLAMWTKENLDRLSDRIIYLILKSNI